MAKCGAKNKRGERCTRTVMPGQRCYWHGGRTPKGTASPQFKHGRYSKYLPTRLLAGYQEAIADPEILSLHDELGLVRSRTFELMQRVTSGESGQVWQQLKIISSALTACKRRGDLVGMADNLNELQDLIRRGQQDYQAWNELLFTLDQQRRLAESEQKRLVAMQQYVTSEQVLVLMSALLDSVKRNVSDKKAFSAIAADFDRLMHRTDNRQLTSGSE